MNKEKMTVFQRGLCIGCKIESMCKRKSEVHRVCTSKVPTITRVLINPLPEETKDTTLYCMYKKEEKLRRGVIE